MLWVILFAAIALAGVVMAVCYVVWLWHKASDVMSEVTVLAERGAQLADLLSRIQPPVSGSSPNDSRDLGSTRSDRVRR